MLAILDNIVMLLQRKFEAKQQLLQQMRRKNKVKRESLASAFQREMVFATLSISLGVLWPGNHPDRILGSRSRDCLYSCAGTAKTTSRTLKSCSRDYERDGHCLRRRTARAGIVVVTRAMNNATS